MPEIFRVENPNSMQGLWYDKDGNFNSKTILTLTDAMAKDMPMDPDPDYGLEGLRWYSGCESIPELSCVFSYSDIVELEVWATHFFGLKSNDIEEIHGTLYSHVSM